MIELFSHLKLLILFYLIHNFFFFWIAASAADIPADNSNEIKTLLANGGSTLFINGKPSVINGLIKVGNPPSWLVILVRLNYFYNIFYFIVW